MRHRCVSAQSNSGTERWDKLLDARAEMSGKLVLSAYSRKAIEAFKKPQA